MKTYNKIASFTVPLKVNKNKVKPNWFFLNMNNFIQISKFPVIRNKVKQQYQLAIAKQIAEVPVIPHGAKVAICYHIWMKDKRLTDVGNIGAIVDKFVQDALVEANKLWDDNYQIVREITFVFGGIDPLKQGYAVVSIAEILEENNE